MKYHEDFLPSNFCHKNAPITPKTIIMMVTVVINKSFFFVFVLPH